MRRRRSLSANLSPETHGRGQPDGSYDQVKRHRPPQNVRGVSMRAGRRDSVTEILPITGTLRVTIFEVYAASDRGLAAYIPNEDHVDHFFPNDTWLNWEDLGDGFTGDSEVLQRLIKRIDGHPSHASFDLGELAHDLKCIRAYVGERAQLRQLRGFHEVA